MKRILLALLAAGWAASMMPGACAGAESGTDSPLAAEKPAGSVESKPAAKLASGRTSPLKKGGVKVTPEKQAASAKPMAPEATKAPAVVDSLELLERAVARDSSRFENLYRLGGLYLDRDRIPDATRVLTKANMIRPGDVGTLVNLGAAYDAAGSADEAQSYYRKALEVSPDDSIATCRLASSFYAQSKYPQAIDLLRGLVASKPRSHCAYFTLGVAFADAGIYRDAIRMWQKVVELAPGSPEATSATESIDVLEKFIKTK